MLTYLITLDEDEDRRRHALEQCALAGLAPQIHPGVKHKLALVGCATAHRNLWKRMETPCLILEDDVVFEEPVTFKEDLRNCVADCGEDVGVLMLGSACYAEPERIRQHVFFVPPGKMRGTHAYAVLTPAGRDLLLELPFPDVSVDFTMGENMPYGSLTHSRKEMTYQQYGFARKSSHVQNLRRYRTRLAHRIGTF